MYDTWRQKKNKIKIKTSAIIKGLIPKQRAGTVQSNAENTILPHTLPVYCASKNFVHHLANKQTFSVLTYYHMTISHQS